MTFKPGESGNKSGRPKIVAEIKELALSKAPAAFEKIVSLMSSPDPKVAMAAAREILDRAYGKPAQAMEHSGSINLQPVINFGAKPSA